MTLIKNKITYKKFITLKSVEDKDYILFEKDLINYIKNNSDLLYKIINYAKYKKLVLTDNPFIFSNIIYSELTKSKSQKIIISNKDIWFNYLYIQNVRFLNLETFKIIDNINTFGLTKEQYENFNEIKINLSFLPCNTITNQLNSLSFKNVIEKIYYNNLDIDKLVTDNKCLNSFLFDLFKDEINKLLTRYI